MLVALKAIIFFVIKNMLDILSILIPKISFILGILMQRSSSIIINKGLKAIEQRFEMFEQAL